MRDEKKISGMSETGVFQDDSMHMENDSMQQQLGEGYAEDIVHNDLEYVEDKPKGNDSENHDLKTNHLESIEAAEDSALNKYENETKEDASDHNKNVLEDDNSDHESANGYEDDLDDLDGDNSDDYEDSLKEGDSDDYEDGLEEDDFDDYEDALEKDDSDDYEDGLDRDKSDDYEDDIIYEDDYGDELNDDADRYEENLIHSGLVKKDREKSKKELSVRERQRAQFLKEDAVMKRKSGLMSISLFAAVMLFFGVIGMLLPLRPTESVIEKRELKKFPEASLISVLEGDYFSEISDWYSDSYPMRDTWMKMSDFMKRLYGIRTVQVIVGDNTKDEIPEATRPSGNISNDIKETEDESQNDLEIIQTGEVELSEAETNENVENTTIEEQSLQTEEEYETVAKISAERQNGLLVNGDSAFGIYYFNREAADTYIAAVNRTAERLDGQADVYCMLVPLSSSFYLSEETLKGTDGSDEVAAMNYYYNSLDTRVIQVPIYDTLKAHQSEYIYFRTDHHWNGLGAYYAYREFASAKEMVPHELSEYELREYPNFTGSYYVSSKAAAMESNPDTVLAYVPITYNTMTFTDVNGNVLNWPIVNDVSNYPNTQKYSCFAGSDNPFSVIENPNVTNGQVCLVIKESYGNALIPFLTDHYQTIYWIDYRDYDGDMIDFAKTHGVNDVIFVNGMDPLSSVEKINRLSELLP